MSNPAETYEREMVPVLFEPWAAALLDHARLADGERILDIACGTGIVARRAARRLAKRGQVSGVDLNPNMIAVARAAADREGVTIDWREGNAESLPFGDGEFDLVLCQQGLQFVSERPRAVAEMHRVLDRGGRTAIALWRGLDHHPLFAAMNEVITRHLGMPALAMPFSFGEPAAVRALLENAGFRDVALEERSMTARYPNP
jgi:ubiquinone/menaquinone biosynthesis C-methylase UbiE